MSNFVVITMLPGDVDNINDIPDFTTAAINGLRNVQQTSFGRDIFFIIENFGSRDNRKIYHFSIDKENNLTVVSE